MNPQQLWDKVVELERKVEKLWSDSPYPKDEASPAPALTAEEEATLAALTAKAEAAKKQ